LSHTAIFEDPHHFTWRAVLVKFWVGEISWLYRQIFGSSPIPFAFCPMTADAASTTQKNFFAFSQNLGSGVLEVAEKIDRFVVADAPL